MKKTKVGLIRVLTTDDKDILYAHEKKLMKYFSNLQITTRCIPNQPEGIYDENTEKMAIPKIVELAKQFEKEYADIVFISCANDPALRNTRQILSIPVIGAGSCCATFALGISNKIGILMITQNASQTMVKILGDNLISCVRPTGVNKTLDLLTEEGKRSSLEAVERLTEKGCDTIALACTGMSTIGFADMIKKTHKVNVIDPVLAAGLLMSYRFF